MSSTIDLSGTIGFSRTTEPDDKFKRWYVDLYLDAKSEEVFNKSGMQNEKRKDKEGSEYIRLSRPVAKIIKDELVKFQPPNVFYNMKKFDGPFIPFGSKITVRMEVYDTIKGKGSRIEKIRVDEIAEGKAYEAKEDIPF